MNIQTYAELMDKTVDWPWVQFFSHEYKDSRSIGKKQERINKLSRYLFLREFEKQYPKETTQITFQHKQRTGKQIKFNLRDLAFKTNCTNYSLIFQESEPQEKNWPESLGVQMEGSMCNMGNSPRKPYVEKSYIDYELTPESKDLLQKMVSYGFF